MRRKLPEIDFPAVCRYLRERGRWTQKEFADRIGADLRNYQRWEAGSTKPNPDAAFHLCRLLFEIDGKIEGKWYKN
ncbi:MAG: helix-turn-helix transcriptional regulator [Acidobacteriota bacterium]